MKVAVLATAAAFAEAIATPGWEDASGQRE
jgi:hypothetical protein